MLFSEPPFVVAITGASGAIYAIRLVEVLLHVGRDVHLMVSRPGQLVLKHELNLAVDLDNFDVASLGIDPQKAPSDSSLAMTRSFAGVASDDSSVLPSGSRDPGKITYYHFDDLMAPIASGSYMTAGMVICPCSQSTLSAVAHAAGSNLIHRAADVHLKEHRKLIVVPRETPLSIAQLDNMRRVCEIGAVVLPAMPGWYHGVTEIRDLVDFVVARILDHLDVRHSLIQRWGEGTSNDDTILGTEEPG